MICLAAEDPDDSGSDIVSGILTLFVRKVLDAASRDNTGKSQPMGLCFLCQHKEELKSYLESQHWACLLDEYLASLAAALTKLRWYRTEWLESRDCVYDLLINHVCNRCGYLKCGSGRHCVWYFGEKQALRALHAKLIQEKELEILSQTCCPCLALNEPGNHVRHACKHIGCTNPASSCGFCGFCCTTDSCIRHLAKKSYRRNKPSQTRDVGECVHGHRKPRADSYCGFCHRCCRALTCMHNKVQAPVPPCHNFVFPMWDQHTD